MILHDRATIQSATGRNVVSDRSRRSAVSWRKQLLVNRAALLQAWCVHFPMHDFAALRLARPRPLPPVGWDEHWAEAARAYREERENYRQSDVARNVVRQSWPTPQVVIEAILLAVRERGIAALAQPENVERLRGCDARAMADINRRIAKLNGETP